MFRTCSRLSIALFLKKHFNIRTFLQQTLDKACVFSYDIINQQLGAAAVWHRFCPWYSESVRYLSSCERTWRQTHMVEGRGKNKNWWCDTWWIVCAHQSCNGSLLRVCCEETGETRGVRRWTKWSSSSSYWRKISCNVLITLDYLWGQNSNLILFDYYLHYITCCHFCLGDLA